MVQILYSYKLFLSNYSEKTQERYLGNLILFLRYLKENNIKAKDVTKADIYNYIAYMEGLKKNTIEARLLAVKTYYAYLNKDLGNFLFEDIKVFSFDKKLPKYLFLWQIDYIMNYYKDKRNYLIIFLFLNTGMRVSELANIQIENINLKENYIDCKVKGGYRRNIYINSKLAKLLKEYIGKRKKGKLFNVKVRDIQYIVTKPLKEKGIKGSAHTLRHTFATEMYRKTHDILIVKELLGHKSIKSTEIYTHIDNDLIKQAVESNPLANFEVGGGKDEGKPIRKSN